MLLTECGFIEAGEWRLSERSKSGIDFTLSALKHERVIFAFVVDGEAKYVGICQGREVTLTDRMNRIKRLVGAGANERIAGGISNLLRAGKGVKILAFKPPSMEFAGLPLDLVAGLKSPLIEALDPDWNIRR